MRGAPAGLALLAAALVATPPAAAITADARAAGRAAAWLAASPAEGPAGQQADVIVALRAAGRGRASLRTRLARLARSAPAYARTAGGAAKVVMATVAAGGDPRNLAGEDYVRRVTARYAAARYGETAFDQALSMLAIAASQGTVPPAAARATLAARGRGGWDFALSRGGADSVDATGLVIEALAAAEIAPTHPAMRGAAAWMLAQRNRAGGLAWNGGGRATEANATAAAIRALRSMGRRPPASTRAALRGLQAPDGGIRFTRAVAGSRAIATADALIALSGRTLPAS